VYDLYSFNHIFARLCLLKWQKFIVYDMLPVQQQHLLSPLRSVAKTTNCQHRPWQDDDGHCILEGGCQSLDDLNSR
jgi:hypothetical protein